MFRIIDTVDVTWALKAGKYLAKEENMYTLTGALTSLSRIFGK